MIEGGWDYVWPAYAITIGALGVLVVVVAARYAHWTKRARALEPKKDERA
jgi:heme exporter protein CcmD